MVDSFGFAARSVGRAAPYGRSETTECAAAIDKAEVVAAKAHDMVAVVELSEADEFADQSLADEGVLASPFDFAPRAHPPRLMVGVVPRVLDARRHRARRGRIEVGRRPLPERLVRPLLVIVTAERVEARLLLIGVGGRRPRGLLLERTMHALMAPVLLRRGGPDEMRLDAELEPPGRKARQSACALEPKGAPLSQRIASGRP